MPTVTTTFDYEDTTYTVTGSADFCGPYAECEGAMIEEIEPATDDADILADAEQAVQDAAYEAHKARHGAPHGDPNDDYGDYDHGYSSGPDYWQDSDSGEYRCG